MTTFYDHSDVQSKFLQNILNNSEFDERLIVKDFMHL